MKGVALKRCMAAALLLFSVPAIASTALCRNLLTRSFEIRAGESLHWQYFEWILRNTPRTGWGDRAIPPEIVETILEHMQKVRLAVLAYTSDWRPAQRAHAARMAVTHDLGETLAGDMTPQQKIPRVEKLRLEAAAWDAMIGRVPELRSEKALWLEFEEGKTPASRLVKQLDQLDAAVQALVYERMGFTAVSDFFPYARARLTDPVLIKTLEILLERKFEAVPVYEQYFFLLRVRGNCMKFEREMRTRESVYRRE